MQRNWAQKFEYTFFFGILTQKTKIEALEELKWQKMYFLDNCGQKLMAQTSYLRKNSIHHKLFIIEFLHKIEHRDLSLRFINSLKP